MRHQVLIRSYCVYVWEYLIYDIRFSETKYLNDQSKILSGLGRITRRSIIKKFIGKFSIMCPFYYVKLIVYNSSHLNQSSDLNYNS